MIKLFEIRDRATFIPTFAFRACNYPCSPEEFYLWERAGYGSDRLVVFGRLEGGTCHYDPFSWGSSRTMQVAHLHLEKYFDELPSGSVIDVQFILGETAQPKISERLSTCKNLL